MDAYDHIEIEADDNDDNVPRRNVKDRINPLTFYNNEEFQSRFRMSKQTALFCV